MRRITIILTFASILSCLVLRGQHQIKKDTLNFFFEKKRISGFLWHSAKEKQQKLIVIVPGSGTTSFGNGNRYYDSLINGFIGAGFSCFAYDKQGCGNSEGAFNINQDVHNSAKEVQAAIAELRKRKISGSRKPGMWGLSRAGWICPLVIAEDPSIAFWISVSGTDDKETFPRVLDCWFRIEAGKSEEESQLLVSEWIKGNKLGMTNATPEEYLEATKHLRADSFYVKKVGYKPIDPVKFMENQRKNPHNASEFDTETGLYIYVHNFRETMSKVRCPVLAIFGEKDCNVDWKRTLAFYESTIGKSTDFTVRTFPDCNHNIQKCETGHPEENLRKSGWAACDGYYKTMEDWLALRKN